MHDINGLMLWAAGRDGLAEPLAPDALAAAHPLWGRSLQDCTDWQRQGEFWSCSGVVALPAPVLVCGDCGSSLDVAWDFISRDALPEWGAVLALSQQSGRGQLRRPWASPPGNLYAAWRWPALPEGFAPLVSLAAGAVAAKALEEAGCPVLLKWPNDLLLADGRKVGGILVEERGGKTLVGLGLNLVSAPNDAEIRELWSPRAGVLSPLSDQKNHFSLWSGLVNCALSWYEALASSGNPRNFLDALEPRLAWIGRTVRVWGTGDEYTAVPLGLADDGGLILRRGNDTQTLHSGSIALI